MALFSDLQRLVPSDKNVKESMSSSTAESGGGIMLLEDAQLLSIPMHMVARWVLTQLTTSYTQDMDPRLDQKQKQKASYERHTLRYLCP